MPNRSSLLARAEHSRFVVRPVRSLKVALFDFALRLEASGCIRAFRFAHVAHRRTHYHLKDSTVWNVKLPSFLGLLHLESSIGVQFRPIESFAYSRNGAGSAMSDVSEAKRANAARGFKTQADSQLRPIESFAYPRNGAGSAMSDVSEANARMQPEASRRKAKSKGATLGSERAERRSGCALHAQGGRIDLAKRIEAQGGGGGHAVGHVPARLEEPTLIFHLE